MKKTIKTIAVIAILAIAVFGLSGCGKQANKNNSDENKSSKSESTNFIDSKDSYFISIDGKKFYAGDKISDLESAGYTVRKSEANEKVPANKYMIGAGHMVTKDNKSSFSVTPYNNTGSSVNVSEAVIGGVDFDDTDIKYDEKIARIEVYGGIKIGSTKEEVKKVFGEPSSTVELSKSTSCEYKSKETYRSYTFKFDKEGKVTGIEWQNLVLNK
ncbi:MAG TPA: outer membrane protein assembly factor BamE [Clostridiaceae bacterium]|jgi:ABC-type phosphate transport system substrate-binding protein|nr:outer membrane protein assembly factor BamE [Clostridiaceae bacterium]